MNKLHIKNYEVLGLALNLHKVLSQKCKNQVINIYPIPRGGIPAAYALKAISPHYYNLVDNVEKAHVCIDDIIDSGKTSDFYYKNHAIRTYALIDKQRQELKDEMSAYLDKWIVWPWESTEEKDDSFSDNIVRLLQFVGEDPNREGLLETPKRVEKAWKEWTAGYNVDIKSVLKVFEDGGEKYDQMVIVKDIPIYSKCEHHLADIFGTATIAYIPDGKIVGLSKLSRLAEAYARRLQVQERLTQQIADAIQEYLQPKGVGVIIRARHMCMESRGLCQQGHYTITTALHGALKMDQAARAEFMSLV